MKNKFRAISIVVLIVMFMGLLLGATGCWRMTVIPSGYIGKILTPSGFNKEFLPPGQVNLGGASCVGNQSRLVILENTTMTQVEMFRDSKSSNDGQDHRIVTKDGVPTTVDMYVRVTLPDDNEIKNLIFLQVTPEKSDNELIAKITLANIYARFVEMDTRNRVRDVISKYLNFQDVLNNYSKVNQEVTAAVIAAFKDSHVPLKLQDAQLSQVLPDPQVWDSEVKKKASEALQSQIQALGETIASNPSYIKYLQWQAMQEIAKTGNLIIVTDGSDDQNIWAATQTTLEQMKKLLETLQTTPAIGPAPAPTTPTKK